MPRKSSTPPKDPIARTRFTRFGKKFDRLDLVLITRDSVVKGLHRERLIAMKGDADFEELHKERESLPPSPPQQAPVEPKSSESSSETEA